MFVTVIKDEAKQLLVRFLETFGFEEVGQLPDRENEWVFEKSLQPDQGAPIEPSRST